MTKQTDADNRELCDRVLETLAKTDGWEQLTSKDGIDVFKRSGKDVNHGVIRLVWGQTSAINLNCFVCGDAERSMPPSTEFTTCSCQTTMCYNITLCARSAATS